MPTQLRRDQLAERRANFQRQTLLELQEAVQDLFRATGAAHVQDERAFRETRHCLNSAIQFRSFLLRWADCHSYGATEAESA